MEIPTKECMPCIVSIYLYAKLSQVLTCCNNEYMKSIETLVGFHVFIHHVSVSSSILNLYIGFRWIQILDGFRTQALTCCNNVGFHIFIHHVPVSSSIYIYIYMQELDGFSFRWIQDILRLLIPISSNALQLSNPFITTLHKIWPLTCRKGHGSITKLDVAS